MAHESAPNDRSSTATASNRWRRAPGQPREHSDLRPQQQQASRGRSGCGPLRRQGDRRAVGPRIERSRSTRAKQPAAGKARVGRASPPDRPRPPSRPTGSQRRPSEQDARVPAPIWPLSDERARVPPPRPPLPARLQTSCRVSMPSGLISAFTPMQVSLPTTRRTRSSPGCATGACRGEGMIRQPCFPPQQGTRASALHRAYGASTLSCSVLAPGRDTADAERRRRRAGLRHLPFTNAGHRPRALTD